MPLPTYGPCRDAGTRTGCSVSVRELRRVRNPHPEHRTLLSSQTLNTTLRAAAADSPTFIRFLRTSERPRRVRSPGPSERTQSNDEKYPLRAAERYCR
jgi:hypothetical protein